MARRKRRKRHHGGGRITPKKNGRRGRDVMAAESAAAWWGVISEEDRYKAEAERDSLLRHLTDQAVRVVERCAHIGDAEYWASAVQCVVKSDPSRGCVDASALLDHAANEGGAIGALLAGAVAAYGPLEARGRARRLQQRLSEDSPNAPVWIGCLGEVTPLRAVRIADEWDEYSIVMVDYEWSDGTVHGLAVYIHPFYVGMVHRFVLLAGGVTAFVGRRLETNAGSGKEIVERASTHGPELLEHFYHDDANSGDAHLVVDHLGLSDARAIIEAGLQARDMMKFELSDSIVEGFNDNLNALVTQRLRLLPVGGSSPDLPVADLGKSRALLAKLSGTSFTGLSDYRLTELSGTSLAELSDPLLAEFVALPVQTGECIAEFDVFLRSLCEFRALCVGCDVLAWTPPRVTMFLEKRASHRFLYCQECEKFHSHRFDEKWITTVESAFPRWLRFIAERSETTDSALDASLAMVHDSLQRMRRHTEVCR